tara:strand:+ start:10061 stop:10702 length:642 start_codon:yes stop_codon:yes gene_type:complete
MLDNKSSKSSLSNEDVVKGLKEALTIGVEKGSIKASKINGFLHNKSIRLPFPPDAQKVKEVCLKFRLDAKVEEFEETLNAAAEEACKTAAPIFKNAVLNMSLKDGFKILKGEDNAATIYLKRQTSDDLYAIFLPEVKKAIDKVRLTSYWEPLTKKYNQTTRISGNEPVNTDLNKYVTEKAIDGIFHLIEIEEKAIRKDPLQRTSDLLKKVFGN